MLGIFFISCFDLTSILSDTNTATPPLFWFLFTIKCVQPDTWGPPVAGCVCRQLGIYSSIQNQKLAYSIMRLFLNITFVDDEFPC